MHEVSGVQGAIVSSLVVDDAGAHARITVRSRGKTVGSLIVDPADVSHMVAHLLSVPPGIDKMVSLVESIAKPNDPADPRTTVEAWQDEARAIMIELGWL